MSEPIGAESMHRDCYFADYGIFLGERFRMWGQATLDYRIDGPADFDPAQVLALIRERAAGTHGVGCIDVRVRALHRL